MSRFPGRPGPVLVACALAGLLLPQVARADALPARAERVADYDIRVSLDPEAKTLDGQERIVGRNPAPEPVGEVSLSSLRGKYVLLTFWSAASNDCVTENLQLKELYRKYNSRGFEIYQINLDTDAEVWKRAVKFDELPWISVREDDPLKPRNAIFYNVRVLPANYLYDREGNIIANNLHGRQQELKLTQLFGN